MAVAGTLSLTGTLTGNPEGSRSISLSWAITAGKFSIQADLSSGANTITVPTGTTLVIVIPPSTNTETITAKGVSGDTGFQLKKTAPSVIAWETGASFVLTAGGAITGVEIYFV